MLAGNRWTSRFHPVSISVVLLETQSDKANRDAGVSGALCFNLRPKKLLGIAAARAAFWKPSAAATWHHRQIAATTSAMCGRHTEFLRELLAAAGGTFWFFIAANQQL